MKIGIDLDEVTVNLMEKFLEYYKSRTQRHILRDDIKEYDFERILGISGEQSIKIVNEFFNSEHFDNLPPVEGAVEGVRKLRESHDTYIITARYGIPKEKTPNWIEKNLKGLISGVFYSCDYNGHGMTKVEICREHGIELILEDDPFITLKCAKAEVKVILFRRPWNKNINYEYVTPVNSWAEALRQIEALSKNT